MTKKDHIIYFFLILFCLSHEVVCKATSDEKTEDITNKESNQEFRPVSISRKLNILGAYALNDIIKGKKKNQQIDTFVVAKPTEMIPILTSYQQEFLPKRVIFIVLTGGMHWTPVVVVEEQSKRYAFILESLGVEKSKVGKNSVAQIAIILNGFFKKQLNIVATAYPRQIDNFSCGFDAFAIVDAYKKNFLAIEQDLLKILNASSISSSVSQSDILDSIEKNSASYETDPISLKLINFLPVDFAKFCQSFKSTIENAKRLSENELNVILKRERHFLPRETLSHYAERKKKFIGFIPKNIGKKSIEIADSEKTLTVCLNSINITYQNSALAYKANKFIRLIENFMLSKKEKSLVEMAYNQSGLRQQLNADFQALSDEIKTVLAKYFEKLLLTDMDDSVRQNLDKIHALKININGSYEASR